jgi:hypothetical protein
MESCFIDIHTIFVKRIENKFLPSIVASCSGPLRRMSSVIIWLWNSHPVDTTTESMPSLKQRMSWI